MSTPTPTPRTDAAWAQTFDANAFLSGRRNAANQMRDECATLERELTALTAERDQLRARAERAEAAETVALANWNGALERAMKAEAERDHLHAQLRALTLICGTNDANKFETWIDRANARAEKAEAELAKIASAKPYIETFSDDALDIEYFRHLKEVENKCLEQAIINGKGEQREADLLGKIERLERELDIERARLNWLETPSGMDWQWEPERLTVSRASIDAAMKEDAK